MADTNVAAKPEIPAYIADAEKLWGEKAKELQADAEKGKNEFIEFVRLQGIQLFKEHLQYDSSYGGYDWRISARRVKVEYFRSQKEEFSICLLYENESGEFAAVPFVYRQFAKDEKFNWRFKEKEGIVVSCPSGKAIQIAFSEMDFYISRG